jgi:hypothetical protein
VHERQLNTQSTQEQLMNKTLCAVAAAVLSASAFAASAGTETPRIDRRQAHQEQRIDQGIASGELTRRETHRLERQQTVINSAEDRAKADGAVTAQERKRLTRMQNKASHRIYRQKHDAQELPRAK